MKFEISELPVVC